ncbi:MAG: hypothetical protein WDA09_00150 [Bacteriovoracaceae bacterium]
MKSLITLLLFMTTFNVLGYVTTTKVEVCTIPLPVTSHIVINRMIFNTKHIYLKVKGETFGTPFTAKGSYFGGDAFLYSEDIFFKRFNGEGEECFPVHHRQIDLEENFEKRLHCIAKKMTVHQKTDLEDRQWYPIFDYHFLRNNCGSMANYLVECAEGKILKKINYSIGDKVEDDHPAKIMSTYDESDEGISSTYGEICQIAKNECEEEFPEISYLKDLPENR